MKTRVILLIAASAIVTLSFTFVSVTKTEKATTTEAKSAKSDSEPIGGFLSEDKL